MYYECTIQYYNHLPIFKEDSNSMHIITHQMLGEIPECYPNTCECGFSLLTDGADDKKTSIKCCNTSCISHTMFLIPEMLNKLNISADFAEKRSEKLLQVINLKTHIDIFGLTEKEITTLGTGLMLPVLKIHEGLKTLNSSGGITLPTYMSLWGFTKLGISRCNKIFESYDSIERFYSDIIDEGVMSAKSYIASKLGIAVFTETVDEIYKTLVFHKEDITRCSKYFIIKPVGDKIIHVAITGEIEKVRASTGERYKPRDKFFTHLSDEYGITFILDLTFQTTTRFLIHDGDYKSSSKKYKAASRQEYNISDENAINLDGRLVKVILTSAELEELCKKGLL